MFVKVVYLILHFLKNLIKISETPEMYLKRRTIRVDYCLNVQSE